MPRNIRQYYFRSFIPTSKPRDKMICRYLKIDKNYIKYINPILAIAEKNNNCSIGQK